MTTSLQDIIICSRTCRLLPKDLDVTDKQAMESTLRLFDIGTDHNGNKTRVSMFRSALELEPEYYGTRLVLEFWHRCVVTVCCYWIIVLY